MFQIGLAGKIFTIDNRYSYVRFLCRDYLLFNPSLSDFTVSVPETEIEELHAMRPEFSKSYCESICLYRQIANIMLPLGTLLFHAALLTLDDEAYVFSADTGVGKTTHISLWQKTFGSRVKIINGDKPFIKYDAGSQSFWGLSTPWCGKENIGFNKKDPVRIKAICFLKRGKENRIRSLEAEEILLLMQKQIYIPRDEKLRQLQKNLLEQMAHQLPFYELSCNASMEAARKAYEGMKG